MAQAAIQPARQPGPMVWTAVVLAVFASVALSRAFACATPFAALAAFAAVTLRKRDAAVLMLLAWTANQAVGFGLLHYPHTASTLGWGGVIGIAALGALGAALVVDRVPNMSLVAKAAVSLLPAYAAYEGVLATATVVLPSGSGAFAGAVVVRILAINGVALGLLLALHRVVTLVEPSTRRMAAAPRG